MVDDSVLSNHREYLVGQTIPQPTGESPAWGRVGGGGAWAGGAGGGGGAAGASVVSAVDRCRGAGHFSGGGNDALLQVIGWFGLVRGLLLVVSCFVF